VFYYIYFKDFDNLCPSKKCICIEHRYTYGSDFNTAALPDFVRELPVSAYGCAEAGTEVYVATSCGSV
jgi:hypothetical protein